MEEVKGENSESEEESENEDSDDDDDDESSESEDDTPAKKGKSRILSYLLKLIRFLLKMEY